MNACRSKLSAPVLCLLLWQLNLLGGCDDRSSADGPQPQTGLPVVQVEVGSRNFNLEVADNDKSRETGLMFRDSMADDHGMIFVFADEELRQFYMANTRIPLDIAFIDGAGKVVSVKTMLPLDLRITSSDQPAKYAIEMNAGAAAAVGLKVGDIVPIPPAAASPGNAVAANSPATAPATQGNP
jgi:uncharacterized membrane protein (UPF0127 family)